MVLLPCESATDNHLITLRWFLNSPVNHMFKIADFNWLVHVKSS